MVYVLYVMKWNTFTNFFKNKICSKKFVYKVKIKIWFVINSRGVYLQLGWEKTTLTGL